MNDLANIEVGDKVLSYGRWGNRIEFVTKITKTQITTDIGRYRRDTGRLIGADAWSGRWIRIPTEEDFALLRLKNLRETLIVRLEELRGQVSNMDEETVTWLLKQLNISSKRL